jgi:hypothetical protein
MLIFMKSIVIFIVAGNGVVAANAEKVVEATSDAPEGNEVGITFTSVAGIRGAALFPIVKEDVGYDCSGLFGCRKLGCACGNIDEQAAAGLGYTGSKGCCYHWKCQEYDLYVADRGERVNGKWCL